MTLYPDLLPRNYLINHLERLINENVVMTCHMLKIMAQHRNEVFREALAKVTENLSQSIPVLELMHTLTKYMPIEQKYLDTFVQRWFAACKDMQISAKQKNLRMICKFLADLVNIERFDFTSKIEVWFHYCSHFGSNSHVKELKDLISKVLNKSPA